MYAIIGRLNVVILIIMTAPYWMRFLNNRIFHQKSGFYMKTMKNFRKIHKPLGVIFVILGFIHGYLALGTFKIHSGSLLWLSLLITALLGGTFYKTKKKTIFIWHKRMVLFTVMMLLLHLFIPDYISWLF